MKKTTQIAGLYFLNCDTFCIGLKPSPLETADFPENALFRQASLYTPGCSSALATTQASLNWMPKAPCSTSGVVKESAALVACLGAWTACNRARSQWLSCARAGCCWPSTATTGPCHLMCHAAFLFRFPSDTLSPLVSYSSHLVYGQACSRPPCQLPTCIKQHAGTAWRGMWAHSSSGAAA